MSDSRRAAARPLASHRVSRDFKDRPVSLFLSVFLCGAAFFIFLLQSEVQAASRAQGYAPLSVVINEVAWSGTVASSNDEWIELYNPGSTDVDLTGWQLVADDGSPDITLNGVIPAGGFFLLERTDDSTISDIPADQIYTGALSNTGETLFLYAPDSTLIDSANGDGGAWPAGTDSSGTPPYASMERKAVIADSDTAWASNNGFMVNGLDANGDPVYGTPKQPNSAWTPYPPLSIVISEIAWAGTQAYAGDEWIELYNPGTMDIDLSGWILVTDSGNVYIPLSGVMTAGSVYLLERGNDQVVGDVPADLIYTSNEFADGGETLRLLAPDRSEVDTANVGGGSWPAGDVTSHASMERRRDPVTGEMIPDEPFAWITFDDTTIYAHDAAGNAILGSPGFMNWAFTVTPTFTPTVTPTPTSTPTPTPVPEQAVVINEVAWGGTKADSDDEWIELYNPGPTDIDLTGWRLASNDGSPNITLSGIIPADGFFLLERTDDDTVQDIPADLIYSGQLSNGGEVLTLYAPDNSIVDRANGNAGAWPAGSSYPNYASMERRKNPANGAILPDSDDTAWITNSGKVRNGLDADGNPINGTPRQPNWAFSVTPTPSPVPTHAANPVVYATPAPVLVLNEFLPHPGSDWNNDGEANVYDEFVEVFNAGVVDVELDGWELDDEEDLDSDPYPLPDLRLRPGERAVFYRSETDIALSDAGDTVRLLDPYGEVADAYTYGPAPQADVSVCRLPDGRGLWVETCFPTPNRTNGVSGVYPPGKPHRIAAPLCLLPDTAPLPFRIGECGLAGEGTWNPTYWDDLAGDPPWLDRRGKWEVWGR